MKFSLPKGSVTADQLDRLKKEKMENDPLYKAQVEAVEAERKARNLELDAAEQPILEDLEKAGFHVASVWDFVNTSEPYYEALPILIDHFEQGGYPDTISEGLGRALAVKPSVQYWKRLLSIYLSADDAGKEDGAAVALAACATPSEFEDLVGLLGENGRGESRIYFLRPILELGGKEGWDVVNRLKEDPLYGKEATALLKRRKRPA